MSSSWTCSLLLLIAVASSRIGPVKNVSPQPTTKPYIYAYEIKSTIKYRYAITEINTRVSNPINIMQQFNFSVIVPETAFISQFSILSTGPKGPIKYEAYVQEKTEAHRIYSSAVNNSKIAGHLQGVHNSNLFSVSVNLLSNSKTTFNLTYEERLEREQTFYVNRIYVTPGQVVQTLKVSVNITESLPIRTLEVSDLRCGQEVNDIFTQSNIAKISRPNDYTADVIWNPTKGQQSSVSENGTFGHIIIRYDVDRQKNPNQILVRGGYFVHSFAINGQSKLPTYTIFILDLSRSMEGIKLEQLKKAMNQMLTELTDGDYFTVITFSHNVMVWPTNETSTSKGKYFFEATEVNKQLAAEYVKGLKVIGATNIVDALTKGIELAKSDDKLFRELTAIIFFLSDGEPNVAEKNTDKIMRNITELNNIKRCPIFSLAFGKDANFTFLNQFSMSNFGSATKIYVNSNSDLQIKNFYTDISRLALTDVSFHYLPEQVDLKSVTNENFRSYFLNKDITVFGKLVSDSYPNITANVTALQDKYPLPKVSELIIDDGDLERMWAYKYIKKLLNETNDPISKKKALELSLEYSFVTSLTSLVALVGKEVAGDLPKPSSLINGSTTLPAYFGPSRFYTEYSIGSPFGSLGRTRYFAQYYTSGTKDSWMNDYLSKSTNISSLTTPSFPEISTDTVSTSTTPVPTTTTGSPEAVGEIYGIGMVDIGMEDLDISAVVWLRSKQTITFPNSTTEYAVYSNGGNIPHQDCVMPNTAKGRCRHIEYCVMPTILENFEDYLPYSCVIEQKYVGICCPETGVL